MSGLRNSEMTECSQWAVRVSPYQNSALVAHLDGIFIAEQTPLSSPPGRTIQTLEASYDITQGGSHEKVLLFEAEFLPPQGGVTGIQNLKLIASARGVL